jgi:hypothetical protein
VVGSGLALTGTASAAPSNCRYGTTGPSAAGSYAGWAQCSSGSGSYRVGATCNLVGEIWSIYGPWVYRTSASGPNTPRSYAYCPAGAKPTIVYVTTRS